MPSGSCSPDANKVNVGFASASYAPSTCHTSPRRVVTSSRFSGVVTIPLTSSTISAGTANDVRCQNSFSRVTSSLEGLANRSADEGLLTASAADPCDRPRISKLKTPRMVLESPFVQMDLSERAMGFTGDEPRSNRVGLSPDDGVRDWFLKGPAGQRHRELLPAIDRAHDRLLCGAGRPIEIPLTRPNYPPLAAGLSGDRFGFREQQPG